MTEDDSLENQESDKNDVENITQNIKNTLSSLEKDRTWLANSLNRSLSTINGWLSAGKSIPTECMNEMQVLFVEERKRREEATKSITATSDEEWENWKEVAYSLFYESVQDWARDVLNEGVENLRNISKTSYTNPIVFPLDSRSKEMWRAVYDFTKAKKNEQGGYTFNFCKEVRNILNTNAKKLIEKEIKKNVFFSLKSAKRAHVSTATENDFKKKKEMFVFPTKDSIVWSIAAALAEEETINEWANKIIDAEVEKALLEQIGIKGSNDDEIPF